MGARVAAERPESLVSNDVAANAAAGAVQHDDVPLTVAQKLDAMGRAFPPPAVERRRTPRSQYRVAAVLETPGSADRSESGVQVYTRDADPNGAGFIARGDPSELFLEDSGASTDGATPADGEQAAVGVLSVPTPDGETRQVRCRIRRARALPGGWFEGSVEFLGPQPVFSRTRIRG